MGQSSTCRTDDSKIVKKLEASPPETSGEHKHTIV